jgi:AraC-like DNA-binding protein
MNTSQLIVRHRLRHAATLIRRNPHKNITWAALSSGFNHLAYFAKAFREFYGISPSKFRSQIPVRTMV